jgi:hypothetical protein
VTEPAQLERRLLSTEGLLDAFEIVGERRAAILAERR